MGRRRSTRSHRSNSVAPSIQHSITLSRIDEPGTAEGEEEGQEIISQQAALRAELVHEEILSHQKYSKQAKVIQDQESKDRQGKSGFLKRMLVRNEEAEDLDET
jgi:hypothetical protein